MLGGNGSDLLLRKLPRRIADHPMLFAEWKQLNAHDSMPSAWNSAWNIVANLRLSFACDYTPNQA
jgi:hypothetical protein